MELCPPKGPFVLLSKPQAGVELKSSQVSYLGPHSSGVLWRELADLEWSPLSACQLCSLVPGLHQSKQWASFVMCHLIGHLSLAGPKQNVLLSPLSCLASLGPTLRLCRLSGRSTVAQGEKMTDLVFHLIPLSSKSSILTPSFILSILIEILCYVCLAQMKITNKFRW